jgi:Kelch motif/Galactose oxidase, central domain
MKYVDAEAGVLCSARVIDRLVLLLVTAALASCGGSGAAYTVGGTIDSLSTSGLVLGDGADVVAVPANTKSFTLPSPVAAGASYTVTVKTQPAGQTCQVQNGSGFVSSAIQNITVRCTGPWVWKAGADTNGAPAIYGVMGTASAGNTPGARTGSATWTDEAGNLWLFGGTYVAASGDTYYLNDLWKFSPSSGFWTWMGGSSTLPSPPLLGLPGVYGTQGIAATANAPGSRANAVTWTDRARHLWLFGGFGNDSTKYTTYLNDLWKYDAGTGQWTWVDGPNTANPPVAFYGTQGVSAANDMPGPRQGASSWTDSSGNLWLFGGYGDISDSSPYSFGLLNDLWMFSPTVGGWTWVSGSNTLNAVGSYGVQGTAAAGNVPGVRSGAVSWIDAQDSLWLFGGGTSLGFANDLWKFTPSTNLWTWVSGSSTPGALGVYGTLGSAVVGGSDPAEPLNVPGARIAAASWLDASGNFWLFGGAVEYTAQTYGLFNDLWQFSPATGLWTWMSGANTPAAAGVYGTLGIASPANVPQARQSAVAWVDGSGNLWLFGGEGNAEPLAGSALNDLWEYL